MDRTRRQILTYTLALPALASPGLSSLGRWLGMRRGLGWARSFGADAEAQAAAAGVADSMAADSTALVHNLRYSGLPVTVSTLTAKGSFEDDADQLRRQIESVLSDPQGRRLRVRSGGHSYIGACVAPGAYLLNLEPYQRVELQQSQGTVRIGVGARLLDLENSLIPLGINAFFPVGDCPTVGLGGFLLGGGVSMLSPMLGLAVDRVQALTMVVFDAAGHGQILRVSATENPDLYWAALGGGGQFGLVTDVTLRYAIVDGCTIYTINGATTPATFPALFKAWHELCADGLDRTTSAKLQLNNNLSFQLFGVVRDATGDLAKLQTFATTHLALLQAQPLSLGGMQTALAGCARLTDCATAWTAGPAYTSAQSTLLSKQWNPTDSMLRELAWRVMQCPLADSTFIQWVRWSGAMAKDNPAVSFPFRDQAYECQVSAVTTTAARWQQAGSFDAWVSATTALLGERRAAYFNHCNAEIATRKDLYFGTAWERLARLKALYDPRGIFTVFTPADAAAPLDAALAQ